LAELIILFACFCGFLPAMDVKLMTDQPTTRRRPWSRSPVAVFGSVAMTAGLTLACIVSGKPKGLWEATELRSVNSTQFEWVEARHEHWDHAADLLIANVKEAGVKRGQIISIDAHSNPGSDNIFTAYYSKALLSKGDLNIKVAIQDAGYSWKTFYNKACAVAGSDTTDVISITSSHNGYGSSVTFVFSYDAPASAPESRQITWVESRSKTWNGAATDIIAKIKAAGAKRGQVVGIDAHNNGCTSVDDAIFSAYLDLTAPGYGNLNIKYQGQNAKSAWKTFYNQASAAANTDVISLTSSCNGYSSGITYVFSYIAGTIDESNSTDHKLE